MTIYILLPDLRKSNGRKFYPQKGGFCVPYAFLRILHFHEQHPKYYPNKNYSKNFWLGISAFKKAQKVWFDANVTEKPKYHYKGDKLKFDNESGIIIYPSTTQNKESEKIKSAEEGPDWSLEEVTESEYKRYLDKAECNDNLSIDGICDKFNRVQDDVKFFAYLFNFREIAIEKLTASEILLYLSNYGPLFLCGFITTPLQYEFRTGGIQTEDQKTQYRLYTIPKYPSLHSSGHAVVLIGIGLEEPYHVYYINPNYQEIILRTPLKILLKQLCRAYYYNCENNNLYAAQPTDTNQKDEIVTEKKICSHIKINCEKKFSMFERGFFSYEAHSRATSQNDNNNESRVDHVNKKSKNESDKDRKSVV